MRVRQIGLSVAIVSLAAACAKSNGNPAADGPGGSSPTGSGGATTSTATTGGAGTGTTSTTATTSTGSSSSTSGSGGGSICNDQAGAPCTSSEECCSPLHCLDDGSGLKCTAQCGNVNEACSGTGQGTCCSALLTCDANTHTCLPVPCDSATTDCDGDGWMVADGDCCDKPGACGAEPEKVNPGALEVVGNGIDDNCNGKTDLFDTDDTLPCDSGLASDSADPLDYAKALGICKTTQENPTDPKQRTWGLIDAKILRADGTPLDDSRAKSIRSAFGSVSPSTLEGSNVLVLSTGIAADATQMSPGPNGGAPSGDNVSNEHTPYSSVDIGTPGQQYSVADWYALPNGTLKPAQGLPDSPGCNASDDPTANDSVMLVLRMRAPTNARAFSFNSYFFSAEYPEFVCTSYNDQFIALVDTYKNGVATDTSPIKNPTDKNLMTYSDGMQKWPIGINIAKGTPLFAVCDSQATNPTCWSSDVSANSCSLGSQQLTGTGFEASSIDPCTIGGGTFWLTTAGNVIPGEIVEIRIAIWDVGDNVYDSLALIDGFKWLANATLPGTGN